ncbi:hypothetical protein AKJ09_03582 [Labilithrix luteola]|uniref:Uncharacterized protein n=1 Tax=Labilithrix luteola TaxID=1391654 RepID=A0A0K1PTP7_9BACT|nr:hypothetical protein [Labilithrix luteola]AKU96918.1 hypothetical protein AKJ09_03582 [Labilithrix luteola]
MAFSAVLAACGGSAKVVEAPMLAADASAAEDAPSALDNGTRGAHRDASTNSILVRGDRYVGHYWCAQGRTQLVLVIDDIEGDRVDVIFEFDFEGSPTAAPAEGSYSMRGTFDANTRTLRLKGDRWIDKVDGYVMVDLVGTVGPSGSISGNVVGVSGCTTFFVNAPRR